MKKLIMALMLAVMFVVPAYADNTSGVTEQEQAALTGAIVGGLWGALIGGIIIPGFGAIPGAAIGVAVGSMGFALATEDGHKRPPVVEKQHKED